MEPAPSNRHVDKLELMKALYEVQQSFDHHVVETQRLILMSLCYSSSYVDCVQDVPDI
jgi:hypothetical protein